MDTKQLQLWKSAFGAEYASREGNRISTKNLRRLMRDWGRMLEHAVTPHPESVLEVGCNIGRNLVALQGFVEELHAVEPNSEAVRTARANPVLKGVNIEEGSGFDLAFPDSSVDLVFTSGVLIHVAPEDLEKVTSEIVRVARHYVLCIEYFSHQPVQVPYHGREGYLFKRDFGRVYLEKFPDLRVLDYGFLWEPLDSSDNSNWWLFAKR
ncbi:MAG: methyltransferase domain-containing protein [Betaproteobacteria bacterium]|nr:methyltransferase domain-containing protein [Betaproteobacteria bacterium]